MYSIAHVLFEVKKKYPQAKNIYVILDNASYNHAKLLKRGFEKTSIKFVFLPPYSPNLNLIERLWRFYHKKITEFKQTSLTFFDSLKEHESELRTLLTDHFNIIGRPTSKIITA